jgi:hypothetical protein
VSYLVSALRNAVNALDKASSSPFKLDKPSNYRSPASRQEHNPSSSAKLSSRIEMTLSAQPGEINGRQLGASA